MPEKYLEEVPARNLRIGDFLGWERGKVVSKDVKQKYVYVYDENNEKPQRLTLDEKILVTRERATPEEAAIARRQSAIESLDSWERIAHDRLDNAIIRVRAWFDAGKSVPWNDLEKLLATQATWELVELMQSNHRTVCQIILRDGEHEVTRYPSMRRELITEYTRFDAAHNLADYVRRQLFTHTSRTHRSTSMMSNLAADYELEAQLEFLREIDEPFGKFRTAD